MDPSGAAILCHLSSSHTAPHCGERRRSLHVIAALVDGVLCRTTRASRTAKKSGHDRLCDFALACCPPFPHETKLRRGSTAADGRSFNSSGRTSQKRCSTGTSTGGPRGACFSSNRYVCALFFFLFCTQNTRLHKNDVGLDFSPTMRAFSTLSQFRHTFVSQRAEGRRTNLKPKQHENPPKQQDRTIIHVSFRNFVFQGDWGSVGETVIPGCSLWFTLSVWESLLKARHLFRPDEIVSATDVLPGMQVRRAVQHGQTRTRTLTCPLTHASVALTPALIRSILERGSVAATALPFRT